MNWPQESFDPATYKLSFTQEFVIHNGPWTWCTLLPVTMDCQDSYALQPTKRTLNHSQFNWGSFLYFTDRCPKSCKLYVEGVVSRILLKNKIWKYTKVMLLNHHFWASVWRHTALCLYFDVLADSGPAWDE